MSHIFKPPTPVKENSKINIFLAGSIEMGAVEDWPDKITKALENYDINILNPRRDDSWGQSIENKQFRRQVEWELDGLDLADIIALYFDAKTKSPISLLELGMYAATGKLIVCCPDEFWKKGNVDVVCNRYDIELCETLDELIEMVIKKLEYLDE